MFVTTVIPIARGISKETLTYVSPIKLNEGALIEVPLRKKNIKALVIGVEDARQAKLALKSSSFSLRKINSASPKIFLPFWSMRVVKIMSDYYASSFGAMLYALVNKKIIEHESIFEDKKSDEKINEKFNIDLKGARDTTSIEGGFSFRLNEYKKIIDKQSSNKKSVVILCPTEKSLNSVYRELLKDTIKDKNENRVMMFGSKTTKKKFQENIESLKELQNQNRGVVIVMTGSYLFLIPNTTSTIIIEEEHSRFYKLAERPFADFSHTAGLIAKTNNINLFKGDILLKSESAMKSKIVRKRKRPITTEVYTYPKNEDSNKSQAKKTPFEPFGKEISEEIQKSVEQGRKIFIYVPRKGYSPIVLCMHCATIVKCNRCDSPVVLHKGKNEENYFLCHHCGEKRSSVEKCKNCDSWKLESFGIGIERVEEEINKRWKKYTDQIDLGTEKNIADIDEEYDLSIIPSIDSLLSLPDFNMDERLLRTILLLKEKTKRKHLLKTKYLELPLLSYIKEENLEEFHQDRIKKRKQFGYAPYNVLIKITVKGKKERVAAETDFIKKILDKWNPIVFPAFIKTVKNQLIMHTLIRVPKEKWPDEEILYILRNFSPSVSVNVDPDSLL